MTVDQIAGLTLSRVAMKLSLWIVCKARFCTESCKTKTMNNYHRVLCGRDFKWLCEACKDANMLSNDMIPLLLMKVLATAIH